MQHPSNCPCAQCEGLRLYPDPTLCDWCSETHPGNAANCYDPEAEEKVKIFQGDTVEDEKLMYEVLGAIREITTRIKEKYMIPNYAGRGQQAAKSTGGSRQAQRSGFPYLNQTNQTEYLEVGNKFETKILDCRVNSSPSGNQSPITLKLAIKGRTVLWGLRTNNPALETLIQLFGQNENDWSGQKIFMFLEEDEFTGQIWPHVGPVEGKKGK